MKNKLDEIVENLINTKHYDNLENKVEKIFLDKLNKKVTVNFLEDITKEEKYHFYYNDNFQINFYSVQTENLDIIDMVIHTLKYHQQNYETVIDMFSLN